MVSFIFNATYPLITLDTSSPETSVNKDLSGGNIFSLAALLYADTTIGAYYTPCNTYREKLYGYRSTVQLIRVICHIINNLCKTLNYTLHGQEHAIDEDHVNHQTHYYYHNPHPQCIPGIVDCGSSNVSDDSHGPHQLHVLGHGGYN